MAWVNIGEIHRRGGKPGAAAQLRLSPVPEGGHVLTITLRAWTLDEVGWKVGDELTIFFDDEEKQIAVVTAKTGETSRSLRKSSSSGLVQTRVFPGWVRELLPERRMIAPRFKLDRQTFERPAVILAVSAPGRPTVAPDIAYRQTILRTAVDWLEEHGVAARLDDNRLTLDGQPATGIQVAYRVRQRAGRSTPPRWLGDLEEAVR